MYNQMVPSIMWFPGTKLKQLGSKCLYVLSHLPSPDSLFLKQSPEHFLNPLSTSTVLCMAHRTAPPLHCSLNGTTPALLSAWHTPLHHPALLSAWHITLHHPCTVLCMAHPTAPPSIALHRAPLAFSFCWVLTSAVDFKSSFSTLLFTSHTKTATSPLFCNSCFPCTYSHSLHTHFVFIV